MRSTALLLLLLALASTGCGPGSPSGDGTPTPAGVSWTDDYACDDAPLTCSADYLRLARELAPEVDPSACRAELEARVQERITEPAEPERGPMGADALATRLRTELGLDPWLEGLDERPLDSTAVSRREVPGAIEQVVRLTDPHVGTLRVRLYWPTDAPRPLPTVLALPGHPETNWGWLDFYDRFGADLVAQGYLVAVPSWRAYDGERTESEATGSLLCAGSSLLAVRQYEALLVDKLLRWMRARGKVGRIGLVAHSGGSAVGSVLVRLVFTFAALVTDMEASFAWGLPCSSAEDAPLCLQEETHPGLHPLRQLIQDEALVPGRVPVLRQEYGYPQGMEPVIGFLDEHLRAVQIPPDTP